MPKSRWFVAALAVVVSLTAACSKSSSPTAPSAAAPVVTTYAGVGSFVLNGTPVVGKLELTVSAAAALTRPEFPSQAATAGSGTVTGTFTAPAGSIALSGTIAAGTVTVQGGGLSFTAAVNPTEGSIAGTGTSSSGQSFAVTTYAVTAASAPGNFAGKFDSIYSGKDRAGNLVFEKQNGPFQFTIKGTPYATNRYYVSGIAVDQSNDANIPFAGTVVMGTGDTPTNIRTGADFLDVHTIGGAGQINIRASYIGEGLWRGVFSGSPDGLGTTNGSFSATPY